MQLKPLVGWFSFLEARGFGEPVFMYEEKERHPYAVWPGGGREVRVSFREKWPTVLLVEGESVTEIEPDFSDLPALSQARGLERRLFRVPLMFRREEVDREWEQATKQLAERLEQEHEDFVPAP